MRIDLTVGRGVTVAIATGDAMTPAQEQGLAKLRQMKAAGQLAPRKILGEVMIETGVNTAVLHALNAAGLITVSRVYLGGRTTPDLRVS